MGLFKKVKDKLTGAVDGHGQQISDGIDKGAAKLSEKTGGKYDDKIQKGSDKAKDALDRLDGTDDSKGDDTQN